jgi:arabinogalactan oligomer/maltooligosaccharide transport system permease protein
MSRRTNEILKQIGLQIFLLVVLAIVLFPLLWVFSMALDPRNIDKPLDLTLIPPGASFAAFKRVLFEPYRLLCSDPGNDASCMTFWRLVKNSLIVALGTSVLAVVLGSTAAYAFSRFEFIGRKAGMLGFIVLLMLPASATLATLFVLLSAIQIGIPEVPLAVYGLGLLASSWALFFVWNMDMGISRNWVKSVRQVILAILAVTTVGILAWSLYLLALFGRIGNHMPASLIWIVAMAALGALLFLGSRRLLTDPRPVSQVVLGVGIAAIVIAVLMVALPALGKASRAESLRLTLYGLMLAYGSGTLPFAIWNLKGYFDTVPKELEEAALIDGASMTQTFVRIIMPLSVPALAVTVLFAFMSGWTEFILAWTFLEDPSRFTLAMALRSMQGQFATPWSDFSALSIVMSIPIILIFFALQRYLVSGLTVGGVKG